MLKEHLKQQGSLCSSVLSFQILVKNCHRLNIDPIKTTRPFLEEFEDIFEVILAVEHRDLQRSLALQAKYQLEPEEALHISLIHGHGIEMMLGPKKPYASVPLLKFIALPLAFENKLRD